MFSNKRSRVYVTDRHLGMREALPINLPSQLMSTPCLSVLFSGNTWSYRSALDEAGVKGGYVDEEDNTEGGSSAKRKYFRILKSIDTMEESTKIQNVLKEVFQNLAMKVIVESEPVEDSNVAELIEELRKIPTLHFEKLSKSMSSAD